jgi:outer membrane protein assembly factor BamB
MKGSALLVSLLLLALSLGILPADSAATPTEQSPLDWPQWRGANRDAVSLETGLLDRWPDGGPRVLWRTEVGAGYSGVAVTDGKLYTPWDENETQFLFCLDARTGKELWRRRLGTAFTNHYGNGPRSTPAVGGGTVFAIGTEGRLVAADKDTGKLLWQHDLVEEFGTGLPSYGYSSSPLIVDDRLVVEAGGKNAAFMGFDRGTGDPVWSSQKDRPAYSSPIDVSIHGVRQVVFWSAHGLHSVSPDDGTLLWKYPWETFCPVTGDPLNTGTPIFVAPDRLFISSGSGAAVLRVLRAGGKFQTETVWKSENMRSDVNTALLLGNYIYGFDRGFLQCLDVRTGEVEWKARGFQRGSLIAADGKLIVLGEAGNLAIVSADPDGFIEKDSAKVLSGKNWRAPRLAGGNLYLRNQEELVCLSLKN